MTTISQLKPWKAITTGELSRGDLFATLKAARIAHTVWAEDLLHPTHFPPHQLPRQVNFGRLRPEELDLRPGDSTEEATRRLVSMGIEPELFIPVMGFDLALACVHERGFRTLVIPLPPFSRCSAMYVSPRSAGFRSSVRADQFPSRIDEGDFLAFALPE